MRGILLRFQMQAFCKLLFVVWCVAVAAFASPLSARAHGAVVYVNELKVLTVKSTFQGIPPEQRASVMALRISRLQSGAEITLKQDKGNWALVSADKVLAVITPGEAAAHKIAATTLGQQWMTNIRTAMSLPPLQLGDTELRICAGVPKFVRVVGTLAEKVSIKSSDPEVVSVKRVAGGMNIKGMSFGEATITVSNGDEFETLQLEVRPYAARFPQTISADVAGLPATVETVEGSIEHALRTRLTAQPGSTTKVVTFKPTQLMQGKTRTYPVRVRVEAPETFPIEGVVNVVVRNSPLVAMVDEELWYCNDPENIKQPGALFSSSLKAEKQARLLYHHINDSPYSMVVEVKLVNTSDKSAQVMVIPGDSGPSKNPVQAGMVAADRYFRGWVYQSGEIVSIPPKSSLPISLRKLTPGDTTSGLCSLRLLVGGPDQLMVRTDARIPSAQDAREKEAFLSATPWRRVSARSILGWENAAAATTVHVYPKPAKIEELNYHVGGQYGSVRIGQRPISSSDQKRALEGNFGVFYTIKTKLDNPTTEAEEVELVFEASAGYTGALFIINKEIRRTPLLQPKTEAQIMKVRMEPGSSKSLTFMTIPLSGSSYPVTLTVRPVDAASSATKPLFARSYF
jgi:hypothetical protein